MTAVILDTLAYSRRQKMNTTPSRAVDAIGRAHALARADARIVSLVPSLTELLFELGVGDRLVGRTGFCIHPKDRIKTVPKVGGTKSVDIEAIRALAPTHLIVNIDENEKPTIDLLAGFVPNVIVTHPLGPLDNPPLYRLIGGIFGRESRAAELSEAFRKAYADAVLACVDLPRVVSDLEVAVDDGIARHLHFANPGGGRLGYAGNRKRRPLPEDRTHAAVPVARGSRAAFLGTLRVP